MCCVDKRKGKKMLVGEEEEKGNLGSLI